MSRLHKICLSSAAFCRTLRRCNISGTGVAARRAEGSGCHGSAVQGRAQAQASDGVRDDNRAASPKVVRNRAVAAGRRSGRARKDLYEVGEIPPLGHVPKQMYAWAIRKERHGPPDAAMQVEVRADLGARQPRRARARDGGGRQLQRRVGGARQADLAARRAQAPLSHRRLRRVRHRLCGRLQGEALEGRRRGRHPLQPGRRRRRGMQRRRPDVLALASASGATRRRTAPSPSSAACRIASCWSGRGI